MFDCRAFFSDLTKSPVVENNISKSYNAVLKDVRFKPIIGLLEEIRRHVMASNLVKIKEIEKAIGLITPKALAIIEKQKKSLVWCHPFSNGRGIYELIMEGTSMWLMFVKMCLALAGRLMSVASLVVI